MNPRLTRVLGRRTSTGGQTRYQLDGDAEPEALEEPRENCHAIAAEMIDSDLDVILGAGRPHYDDDSQPVDEPDCSYIAEEDFQRVSDGETGFTFTDEDADVSAYADGEDLPERAFGPAQVASTPPQSRSGAGDQPDAAKANDVVDLTTMSGAALNVLGQDDDRFHLMIEGGAIAWAGHETGCLADSEDDPGFSPMTGGTGRMPDSARHSEDHTNQAVPFFVRGDDVEAFGDVGVGTAPVRGDHLDNTVVADVLMDGFWATED